MTQPPLQFPVERHAHLKLSKQLPAGDRRRRARAIPGREPNYADQPAHGRFLVSRYLAIKAVHQQRTSVLGVDPALVLVIELHSTPVALEAALRGLKLEVLEWFEDRVVVSAANDPDLKRFNERLELYQQGPVGSDVNLVESEQVTQEDDGTSGGIDDGATGDEPAELDDEQPGRAKHQALFDLIKDVRPFGVAEAITPALALTLESMDDHGAVLVDLQCWCPEDASEAQRLHDEVVAAVATAGGVVHDRTVRHRAGLSLLRVETSPAVILQLASLRHLRRLDVIPRPVLERQEVLGATQADLPIVLAPTENAPLLAVIDSGVRSSHPLLAPAVDGLLAVAGLDAERDEHGHGTFVASLALHGSLETHLADRQPLRPAARLLSVRVLDQDANFPSETLWEVDLLDALALASDAGARIVNLSIADARRVYNGSRPTPLATALDEVARRDDLVLVVSAGNYPHEEYPATSDLGSSYLVHLLDESAASGLLDPATSALALTVGALCADNEQGQRRPREIVDTRPVGDENWPSPITRAGPGAAGMVKPEISMPGGGMRFDESLNRLVTSVDAQVVGAEGRRPDRVLALGHGTSFAAPLVANIAARVLERTPNLTANGVRALVMSSVKTHVMSFSENSAETRELMRRVSGFGRPDADRAAFSTDHRAVLIAEERLINDQVHIYKVPVPPSFKDPGGLRVVSFGLAYDPPTRSTRLDYMASRMHVYAYRGASVDDVARAFMTFEPEITQDPASEEGGDGPSSLERHKIDLQPSETVRSRGAHQFGTWERRQAMTDDEIVFVVQNVNRWNADDAPQAYALAVALERSEDARPLYADLLALVEVPLVAEAEQRLEIT